MVLNIIIPRYKYMYYTLMYMYKIPSSGLAPCDKVSLARLVWNILSDRSAHKSNLVYLYW